MNSLHYFKALSDVTRLRLYHILLYHELSVNEIVSVMDMGQSRISRHLKILTDSNLLICRRTGVQAFYSANISNTLNSLKKTVMDQLKEEAFYPSDLTLAEKAVQDRTLKTRSFFNSIAPRWDLLKKDILGDFNLNEALSQSVSKTSIVADLGCGTGELLKLLAQKAGKIIGVDSSSNMLSEAEKKFSDLNSIIELRLGELEHLPIGDQETNAAVFSLALHHVNQPGIVILEAARAIKSNGELIIAEFLKHTNSDLESVYGDIWMGFTESEIENWLQTAGFTLLNTLFYPVKQSLTVVIYKAVKQ